MKITMEGVGVDITPSLKSFVKSKLESVAKLMSRFEKKGESEIIVEISKPTKHHHKGEIFRAEGNLKAGKILFRAEADGESARNAIDILKDELKREIVSFKEKIATLSRRSERSAKKSLRLSEAARFRKRGST
ncbi:MAG: ribosome-associated translation inhibitor RaiA [Candidatus Liptonbacteria bacterium]|nr:ribosome-associated translation inhibitor RaiA [Candidatus Liptonbacteria bacterium]